MTTELGRLLSALRVWLWPIACVLVAATGCARTTSLPDDAGGSAPGQAASVPSETVSTPDPADLEASDAQPPGGTERKSTDPPSDEDVGQVAVACIIAPRENLMKSSVCQSGSPIKMNAAQ